MKPATPESNATIQIVFRAPDTMILYGLPYKMRLGQNPGDLWRAYRDYKPAPYGWYGPRRVCLDDWVYLGTEGFYAGTSEERACAFAFIKSLGEALPQYPYEWIDITEVNNARAAF